MIAIVHLSLDKCTMSSKLDIQCDERQRGQSVRVLYMSVSLHEHVHDSNTAYIFLEFVDDSDSAYLSLFKVCR